MLTSIVESWLISLVLLFDVTKMDFLLEFLSWEFEKFFLTSSKSFWEEEFSLFIYFGLILKRYLLFVIIFSWETGSVLFLTMFSFYFWEWNLVKDY